MRTVIILAMHGAPPNDFPEREMGEFFSLHARLEHTSAPERAALEQRYADLDKKIAEAYDVLLDAGIALRGLFLIDKDGVVQHQVVNNLPLGRSVDEALRLVKALQFFEANGEVCPANWQEGARTIKPTPDDSKEFFGAEYA